jgi:hypothetical protein
MDYDIIKEKLKQINISNDDLLNISKFLLQDESKDNNVFEIHKKYLMYISLNYEGNLEELNNNIEQILDKKYKNYFGNEKLNVNLLSNVKKFNKSKFYLDIFYRICEKKNLHLPDRHMQILKNIDDKLGYLNLFLKFEPKIYQFCEENTIKEILKYKNDDEMKNFLLKIINTNLKNKLIDIFVPKITADKYLLKKDLKEKKKN